MAGLFDFLQPTQPTAEQPPTADTQQPDLKSQWDSALANPATRAGLLGFGLQMMMGGWGNNLAASLGAGVESMAGTTKIQQEEADKEQKRQDILTQNSESNAIEREKIKSSEKRVQMAVEGRQSVAQLKTSGPMNKYEQTHYNKVYTDTLNTMRTNNILLPEDQQMDETEIEGAARDAAATAIENRRATFPSLSGPTLQGNSGAEGGPGTTPPAGQTAASGLPTGSETMAPYSYDELVTKYGKEKVDSMLPQYEQKFGTVRGNPARALKVPATKPSFKGVAKDTSQVMRGDAEPARSREEAYFGQTYTGKDGYVYRKSIFGNDPPVSVKAKKDK